MKILRGSLMGNLKAARKIYLKYDEVIGEAVEESAEMDQARIERLLKSTQTILSNQEQVARLKGENFNVFRLLGLEEYEVKLHSPFITELLNPKGSHHQGPVFLEMFLQQVNLPENKRVEASKAIVCPERYIGRKDINGENSTGGKIDIFITDSTRHISIENKIGSGKGDHQVDRYGNFEPDKNFVLFLTLKGYEADTKRKNYKPISYRCHIIPWLENCHRHCADLPILRETIKQYIHTVKSLTGGLIMQKVNEDIKTRIRKNIKAAREIHLNYDTVVDEAVKEFAKRLAERIKKELNSDDWCIESTIEKDPGLDGRGLEIKNNKWPKIGKIKWQRQPKDISEKSHYGFLVHGQSHNKIKDKLGEEFNGLRFLRSGPWAFRKFMDKANFQSDINELKKLFDDDDDGKREQDELVEQVANELIDFIKACDHKLAN